MLPPSIFRRPQSVARDGAERRAPPPPPPPPSLAQLPKRYSSSSETSQPLENASSNLPMANALDSTDQSNPIMRRLSRIMSYRRTPETPSFLMEANIAALRGDLATLKLHLSQRPGLLNHVFPTYLSAGPLLTPEEEEDKHYHPPPIFPRSLKGALSLEAKDMSRDQKWLIDHGFAGSTLLHYACAGDQLEIVHYLLEQGIDKTITNQCKKVAEFYTINDLVRQSVYGQQQEKKLVPKKSSLLLDLQRVVENRSRQPPPALEQDVKPKPMLLAPVSAESVVLPVSAPQQPLVRHHVPPPPPPPPQPAQTAQTSTEESAGSRDSKRMTRRMSRVMSARRMSASSDVSKVSDEKTEKEGKLALCVAHLSAMLKDDSNKPKSKLRTIFGSAGELLPPPTPMLEVPVYRPPLAMRRLSVNGHCLESVAYEVDGDQTKETERTEEEITLEEITPPPPPPPPKPAASFAAQAFSFRPGRQLSLNDLDEKTVSFESKPTEAKLADMSARQMEKLGAFAAQLCSLHDIANRVLHENSESGLSEDLVNKLLKKQRVMLPSQASTGTSTGVSTLLAQPMPDLSAKPKINVTKLPFRVMLWKKAGEQLNKGLFDSGDVHLQKRRQMAYENGLTIMRKEFRSYADKEHWEALDRWQEKTAIAMENALLKRLQQVKRLRRASALLTTTPENEQKQAMEEDMLRLKVRKISCLVVGMNAGTVGDSQGYYDIEEELHKLRAWLLETQLFPFDPSDHGPTGNFNFPDDDMLQDEEDEEVDEVARRLSEILSQ